MDRGNSFSNGSAHNGGSGGPPLTITGVLLGQAMDDRWGNGPYAATA
jgi:hypothetical protein